jgi:hypothetical protein
MCTSVSEMRGFLLRLGGFLFPVALVLGGLEWAWRRLPHDLAVKRAYLEAHVGELNLLALGSSHILNGFDASLWPAPAYNAAYLVQTLNYDVALARRYVPRARQLRYLLVPLSYGSAEARPWGGDWQWIEKDFVRRWGLPHRGRRWMDHFEWGGSLRVNIERLTKHWRGEPLVTVDERGFQAVDSVVAKEAAPQQGLEAARRQTYRTRFLWSESFGFLEEMAGLARERGARMILVMPPGHAAYRSAMDPSQVADLRRDARALAERHSSVVLLDFFDDAEFGPGDFHSTDHLNKTGARRLTKKILRSLGEDHE